MIKVGANHEKLTVFVWLGFFRKRLRFLLESVDELSFVSDRLNMRV